MGRTSQNKVVVFPKTNKDNTTPLKKGDYVDIIITHYTKGTLIGAIKNN
jgi:hypothetical protein